MAYFIPQKRDDYRAWLLDYKTQIAVVGPGLGLDAAAILAQQTTCQNQIVLIDAAKLAEDAAGLATKSEQEQRLITNAALQEEINALKAKPTWSDAEATALHVHTTPPPPFDADNYKPVFKLKVVSNGNRLKWTKKGVDSMKVKSRLKGQATFVVAGIFTGTEWIDTRPLAVPGVPETREYQLHGLLNDAEVGQDSDIQSALWDGE